MKQLKKFILLNISIITINFFFYALILSLKRNYSPGVLFYEGIIILFFTTLSLFVFLLIYNKKHLVYPILLSFFIIMSFHTTVLTIVDRSISVFLLNEIKNGKKNNEELVTVFNKNFSKNAIHKRVYEQAKTGNLVVLENKIYLTPKGRLFHKLFFKIHQIFNTDEKIIN